MARKTKERLEWEAQERAREIEAAAEEKAKGLVAGMVPGIVAQIMQQMSAARPADTAPATPDQAIKDTNWAQTLAVAIAGASDPGNKARRVSPEVLESQKKAHEEMIQLLAEAWARQEMPVYIVRSKCFLKERKIEPKWMDPATKQLKDMEINWPQIPNQSMEPMNEVAKQIHTKFLQSISSIGGAAGPAAAFVISGTKMMRTVPVTREVHVPQPMDEFDPRRTSPMGGQKQERQHILGTIADPAVVS